MKQHDHDRYPRRTARDEVEKREAQREIRGANHRAFEPLDNLTSERVRELEAQCAVMRQALEYCGCHEHCDEAEYPPTESHKAHCKFCEIVDNALSTTAGSDLLKQLADLKAREQEARVLLENEDYIGCQEWIVRTEKWIRRRDIS